MKERQEKKDLGLAMEKIVNLAALEDLVVQQNKLQYEALEANEEENEEEKQDSN